MNNAAFFASTNAQMLAKAVHAGTNIPVSVTLAQMGDETGYGTSHLWVACHNPSGMTTNGSTFFCFNTVQQAARQYVAQWKNGYYSNVLATAAATQDPITVAKAIGASPWAGSHYYANGMDGGVLISIIKQYGLTKYDKVTAPSTTTANPVPAPTQPLLYAAGIAMLGATAYYIYSNRKSA